MDAVVIGAGPNGLVAAATLARAGWRVLVLEAQSRPGGAVYSLEYTLPGYLHDVGAAFFPFAQASPALRSLDLGSVGLSWRHGAFDSAHPAPTEAAPASVEISNAARSPSAAMARSGAASLAGRSAWASGWRRRCWRRCHRWDRHGAWACDIS